MALNEKNVVFSAPCPGAMMRANNGIPILVEISKVTTVAVPMTEGAIAEGVETIKDLLRSMKSLYDTGTFYYDLLNIEGLIKAGQGVGFIISGIRKFIPDPENPLVRGLEELENEVKQLEDQISHGFDDIKSFMSEVKFFVAIVSPVSVLGKLMRDCIKHPGPECVINFKEAYEERSPLSLMYSLISFLEQKPTNPIRLALDKGVCLTGTFYTWNDIITNLLGQLLLLEAFATGLLGTNTKFNCEQILEESKEVLTILEKIKNDYEIDKYWDDFKQFLESHQHRHNFDMESAESMKEVTDKLKSYSTKDAFHVIIYEKEDWKYKVWKYAGQHQFAEITTTSNRPTTCFVYRSLYANFASLEVLTKLEKDINSFELYNPERSDQNERNVPQFKNTGFTMLLYKDIISHATSVNWHSEAVWSTDFDSEKTTLFAGFV